MIYQRPNRGVYILKGFPDVLYQILFSVNIKETFKNKIFRNIAKSQRIVEQANFN